MSDVAEWVIVLGLLAVPVWRFMDFAGWSVDDQHVVSAVSESSFVPGLLQPGMTLEPGVLSLGAGSNVVLFMSTTCPFCNSDVQFYRDVGVWARSAVHTRFVVVSNESSDVVWRWLDAHGITVSHVVGSPDEGSVLYSLGIFGTPTVVVVNERGVVTDVIVGELAQPEEEQFLKMLSSGDAGLMNNLPDPPLVDYETLTRLASKDDVVVLDVRDRAEFHLDHDPDAMNIPADELGIRARVEIPASVRIFVDCRVGSLRDCRHAARGLVLDGLTHVAVMVP